MRAITIIVFAGLCALAPHAAAEEREPHFAPFDVAQSPARRGRAITHVEIAGEAVSLNAYGRRARARMLGATKELEEARELGGVFEGAPQPALVTIEASLSF